MYRILHQKTDTKEMLEHDLWEIMEALYREGDYLRDMVADVEFILRKLFAEKRAEN